MEESIFNHSNDSCMLFVFGIKVSHLKKTWLSRCHVNQHSLKMGCFILNISHVFGDLYFCVE